MDTIFIDYDDTLIGRMDAVDSFNFYGVSPGGANEVKAIACIRYALENILEWTEDEAIKKFDAYTIRTMKLERFLDFIDFPVEIERGDPQYILALLYPKRIKISQQMLVERTLMTVLNARQDENGKIVEDESEETSGRQFPREYFAGGIGFKRFCYCIKFLLENFRPMSSVEEIYQFFSSNEGRQFLTEYRLKVPAEQFSINLLDVVRRITENQTNSDLYYSYYSFLNAFQPINDENEAIGDK